MYDAKVINIVVQNITFANVAAFNLLIIESTTPV